jgi:hypothetical protein
MHMRLAMKGVLKDWLESVLNFFKMEFWFLKVVSKHMNCSTLAKELLSIFIFWLCPAVWSPDMTKYLAFSAFTSRPVCLVATLKILCVLWCVRFGDVITFTTRVARNAQ